LVEIIQHPDILGQAGGRRVEAISVQIQAEVDDLTNVAAPTAAIDALICRYLGLCLRVGLRSFVGTSWSGLSMMISGRNAGGAGIINPF
jgi:hypothetical protein